MKIGEEKNERKRHQRPNVHKIAAPEKKEEKRIISRKFPRTEEHMVPLLRVHQVPMI